MKHPVRSRIAFKLNLITYKVLKSGYPVYLKRYLVARQCAIGLRANNSNTLTRGPRSSTHYGSSAYACSAPHFWNQLPSIVSDSISILSFRKNMKTHYFNSPPLFRPNSSAQINFPP